MTADVLFPAEGAGDPADVLFPAEGAGDPADVLFPAEGAVGTARPVCVLDVDGVVVLQDPTVPVVRHTVSASGKWRRDVLVPAVAPEILHRLAEEFDCVWAGAWAHTAHPALRAALDLPLRPWPYLGVQFHKLDAIREFAAGRPWVWIDDAIDDLGEVEDPSDGVLVRVDARRGIADVDVDRLLSRLAVARTR